MMKRTASVFLLGIGFTAIGLPATAPVPSHAARSVEIGERDIVEIHACKLQATVIVLPEGEGVTSAFTGDTKWWEATAIPTQPRFVSIKPKEYASETDMHVMTDHGNDYPFILTVDKPNTPCDVKVFIEAGSEQLKAAIQQPAKFVSAERYDEAKQQADDARKRADEAVKQSEAALEEKTLQFRSEYPAKLHFDYKWDHVKAAKLGIEQIWGDDKFTYVQSHSQEAPIVYEKKDGKPSLINVSLSPGGLYTIPKLVADGYFAAGKQKVEFRREGMAR